jgi:hypothetical protein
MPRSTSSLRVDTEDEGLPADNGDGRIPVQAKNIELGQHNSQVSSFKRPGEGSAIEEFLRWLARSLAVMALLSSLALLCVGATPMLSALPTYIANAAFRGWALVKNMPLSALPLLLAGSSYLVLQAILRPRPLELLKRLMLGAAFLLWGVVQLMPASSLATELGNVVIALYVVDLGLIIWTDLEKSQPRLVG